MFFISDKLILNITDYMAWNKYYLYNLFIYNELWFYMTKKIGSYDRSDRNDRKILSELCVFLFVALRKFHKTSQTHVIYISNSKWKLALTDVPVFSYK